jgi:hypothetical protein
VWHWGFKGFRREEAIIDDIFEIIVSSDAGTGLEIGSSSSVLNIEVEM